MACWVDTRNLQNTLTRSDPTVTLRLALQAAPIKTSMKLIKNKGVERVIDELTPSMEIGGSLEVATSTLSLYAYEAAKKRMDDLAKAQMIIAKGGISALTLLGAESDRAARNRLQAQKLASDFAKWLTEKAEVRSTPGNLHQAMLSLRSREGNPTKAIAGGCSFTTDGLGLSPGNQFNLVQCTENEDEAKMMAGWFSQVWDSMSEAEDSKAELLAELEKITKRREPNLIYLSMLSRIFGNGGDAIDEDKVIKSATGIRETAVWRKLFKFQRDGVIGAIDKLEKFGGCIIADSVGLGKTFEALAIIKYYELRNDRVLVLAPKRLRDNWTLYKSNDKRNVLSGDRLNYDVLNHTDLSRVSGRSGDVELSHINWGNYDLVVIDESHNFRNKSPRQGQETRYDKLMRKIIKEGVKTRVLMLSATPVNNRLADLKNQISFVTEGKDDALGAHGISSVEATVRKAQAQFNRWLGMPPEERSPGGLIDMLGFDYFKLLDLLTIARSRRHVEKYYGTTETGKFPERLSPINFKPDVDSAGAFRSIREINNEIRRLTLAAYAPLRYVLPGKKQAYDEKYSTKVRGGESFFRQADREESLIHLMRINILKRMESSVSSFALTVKRQLEDVEATLAKIDSKQDYLEELEIEDVDMEDPTFESLLVGHKVKVLLKDVDIVRWKQDLLEDRNRLATLYSAACEVGTARDAKLEKLKEVISSKVRSPINAGNRKVIVFTAFADTAKYLYAQLSVWAKAEFGLQSALVTGSGNNQCTLPGVPKDLASILTAFSPRSKERPSEFAGDGDIDIIFATDCISEGQNLQDCDYLINYDIHWNPVRIIQRFGRIDRIGSTNERIQLVNFWPNIELEEYINLEQRVSGRMVLLDISATGEENIIEQAAGNQMNDLEYRRTQLLKLQDAVIDLEDLSAGVSITDLTLTDYRIDLARYIKDNPGELESLPMGLFSVTTTRDITIAPGIVFCIRAEGEAAGSVTDQGYPLAPHYLIHVGDDGSTILPYAQVKAIMDSLKRLCVGKDIQDEGAYARFEATSKKGSEMGHVQKLLSSAIASVVGKKEERAAASLFSPGGTYALKGEFAGMNDFEVMSYLVILPEA